MKTIISSIMCAGAAILLLASCGSDTKTKVTDNPYITLTPSSITLTAEAVPLYTINYAIGNPADNGTVEVSANMSWLSNLDSSTSGQVRFSVSENTSDTMRAGTVTIVYIYDEDFVTATAAVVQYGVGETSLTVSPNAVMANASGGKYSFGYSIGNAITGEDLYCGADVKWITDFDYSTQGTVSFTVAETEEEEALRSGTITVTYADLTKEVTVIQDHLGSESSIIGTYTAHGVVYGNGISVETEMDWTVKIYAYTGTNSQYEYYFDGVVPWDELFFDKNLSYDCDAGAYMASDGTLHIPSQANGAMISSSTRSYYLGYTPCTGKSESGYTYSTGFPDLVFTYDAVNDIWESDYGMMMAGCTNADITSVTTLFQVVLPTITLTKTAETTSLSVECDKTATRLESLEECTGMLSCK